MAKLILRFNERVLKEIEIADQAVAVGRTPDNDIVIDNPAVSGHHASVEIQGGMYVLEDLKSTNGTFVNDQPITRHRLQNGDLVRIGKHTLVFETSGENAPAASPADTQAASKTVPDMGGTVFLDTKSHKELLSKLEQAKKAPTAGAPGPPPPAPTKPKTASLKVISGRTDKTDCELGTGTATIGKSPSAAIRLKGWFKPQVGAIISRQGDSFKVTPVAGKTEVNGQRLSKAHDLSNGDILRVSGISIQFDLKE